MSNELRDKLAGEYVSSHLNMVWWQTNLVMNLSFCAGWDACEKHYKAEIEKWERVNEQSAKSLQGVAKENVSMRKKVEKQSEIIKVLKEALEQYRDGKALLVKPEKRHLYQPDTLEIDAFYLRSMSDYTHTLLAAEALAKVQEMEGG